MESRARSAQVGEITETEFLLLKLPISALLSRMLIAGCSEPLNCMEPIKTLKKKRKQKDKRKEKENNCGYILLSRKE